MKHFQGRNYVNGEWKTTAEVYAKINPATGKYQGSFPMSNASAVTQAVLSARKAFKKWRKVSRFVRSDYLNKVAQIIENYRALHLKLRK